MKVKFASLAAPFFLFLLVENLAAQSVRGLVQDADRKESLFKASIFLMEKSDSSLLQTTTDGDGIFQLRAPRPGVYSLKISHLGFETRIIPEISLDFGKELVLEIGLKPAANDLPVIEIRPEIGVAQLAPGQHALTREAILHNPATFFDPARLAQSLPGVANDDQNNGLSIRGLSPALFQYRIEGLEVVNPNHLSNAGTLTDLPTANSGGVQMLSAQMLGNSSIYTGPTPTGYANSVAGLMDIRLRPGNADHYEATIQAGLVGLDASIEGPIDRHRRTSFLVNYRYSTISLLEKMGVPLGDESVNFQDLSVHLRSKTKRLGTFSAFGIFGESSNEFEGTSDSTKWLSFKDGQNIYFSQKTHIVGFNHEIRLGKIGIVNLGFANSQTEPNRREKPANPDLVPVFSEYLRKNTVRIAWNVKLGQRVRMDAGAEGLKAAYSGGHGYPNDAGFFWRTTPSQSRFWLAAIIQPSPFLEIELAGRAVFQDKNRWFTPKGGLYFRLDSKNRLSFLFERQVQMLFQPVLPLPLETRHLAARSEHIFRKGVRFQAAIFYQKFQPFQSGSFGLFHFSPLDFTDARLADVGFIGLAETDAGFGGLELSGDHQFKNGWSATANATFFDGKQEIAADKFERTRFNNRWSANILIGKEWTKSRENSSKTRTLGLNLRLFGRGGFRETPIDTAASFTQKYTVFVSTQPNTLRLPNYFRADLRLFWKKNRANRTGTLALDIQNLTNLQNVAWHFYDPFLRKVVAKTGLGLVPILSYRLDFQFKRKRAEERED